MTAFAVASWAALGFVGIGFAVGAFGTLVGAGGGFLLTPILLLLYPHDSPRTLTSISLMAVFFNAASGSVAYWRQRRIDVRSGLIFGLATLPGSVAGAIAVTHVGRSFFELATASVLAALSVWLVLGGRARDPAARPRRPHLLLGAVLSVGVGFISTFLGIGGGVVHVPLLVRVLGFPVHIATATSHFVLAIMAGSATVTHLATGTLAWGEGLRRGLALSLGVVLGAQLGAHASLRISGRAIEWLLAVALAALSARLFAGVA